jgi:hypothetical protein
MEEINQARELVKPGKYRAQMQAAELMVVDDLFLRKLPQTAGDELAEVLMSRDEKFSTVRSTLPAEDRPKLLAGDVVVVAPLPRSADASREPAEVRGAQLATEGSDRAACQAGRPQVIIRSSRRCQVEEFEVAARGCLIG